MSLGLKQKREFEITFDRTYTVKELSGKDVFKFDRLLEYATANKHDKDKEQEVAQAYYDLTRIVLPEVSDVWMDKELTGDRLLALIAVQHAANTRTELKKNLITFLGQEPPAEEV